MPRAVLPAEAAACICGGAARSNRPGRPAFTRATGTVMAPISYRGAGPAVADLVAGHVPIIFLGLSASAPQEQSGKLRALAVTGRQRVAEFSDIPTSYYNRRVRTWHWARMRRYGEPSKDQERLLPLQFCSDCITAMRGYDFREGHRFGLG
jgi:hypothetical protein